MQETLTAAWEAEHMRVWDFDPKYTRIIKEDFSSEIGTIITYEGPKPPYFVIPRLVEPYHVGGCI